MSETKTAQARELKKIKNMVQYAQNLGLTVNAGHGLKYHNTRAIACIPGIDELNIGAFHYISRCFRWIKNSG